MNIRSILIPISLLFTTNSFALSPLSNADLCEIYGQNSSYQLDFNQIKITPDVLYDKDFILKSLNLDNAYAPTVNTLNSEAFTSSFDNSLQQYNLTPSEATNVRTSWFDAMGYNGQPVTELKFGVPPSDYLIKETVVVLPMTSTLSNLGTFTYRGLNLEGTKLWIVPR